MDIQSYKISTTKDKSASRSGLAVLAEPVRKLGLDSHFERPVPGPGSSRGLRSGAYLTTFMLMMHEGSRHPGGVAQLREERPLLELLGIRRLPGDDALGRWLRRCEKSSAESACKKERGCMPIVGRIAETGMAAGAEFRGGPVSPNARSFEFVRQCERALPRGVAVHRARIDASVAGQTGALDESRRQPFIERDGTASLAQPAARFLHSMNGTPEASAAVVRRLRKSGRQELEPGCPQAGDTLSQGGCVCRALATSLCRRSDSRAFR